jgi:hypothetical protein
MSPVRSLPISDQEWEQFERDGYLRLGRTLATDELAALQQRIDDIMLGHVKDDGLMMQLDKGGDYGAMDPQTLGFKGPRLDYRKIENLERDDRFLDFLQKPLFASICARVYGADTSISVYRSMFMNKPARKGTLLPWHQDGGSGWGLDRDPQVTAWTALDPATVANGCVQIIPGSHRLGLLSERGHTISAEHEAKHCAPERIVHLELEPGETVLLHNWTLHRSDINRTPFPRRAFSVCYMDARTSVGGTGKTFPVVFGAGALQPLGSP